MNLPLAVGKTGDPVKMYLREMGLGSLLSRKIRFSKQQIDRMVANLSVYLNDAEQAEEMVHRFKRSTQETGLSATALKKAMVAWL